MKSSDCRHSLRYGRARLRKKCDKFAGRGVRTNELFDAVGFNDGSGIVCGYDDVWAGSCRGAQVSGD